MAPRLRLGGGRVDRQADLGGQSVELLGGTGVLEERRSGRARGNIETPPGPGVLDDRVLVQDGDSRNQPASYDTDITVLRHRGFSDGFPAWSADGLQGSGFERNNTRRQSRGAKSFEKSQGRYPA